MIAQVQPPEVAAEEEDVLSGENTAEMSSSSRRQEEESNNDDDDEDDSRFDCNICLDPVNDEPVVTACGHLYCWSCLYKWLKPGSTTTLPYDTNTTTTTTSSRSTSSSRCPVCNMSCSIDTVVPIYVRESKGLRKRKTRSRPLFENIPPRPVLNAAPDQQQQQQLQQISVTNSPPQQQDIVRVLQMMQSQLSSFDYSFSSSQNNNQDTNTEESAEFLSRLLLVLGSFVIVCLLTF